jgi:hypothetical protein
VAWGYRKKIRLTSQLLSSAAYLLFFRHVQKFGLAEWLLNPTNCMSLISTHLADTPTFYQTLAGVTHLSEQVNSNSSLLQNV